MLDGRKRNPWRDPDVIIPSTPVFLHSAKGEVKGDIGLDEFLSELEPQPLEGDFEQFDHTILHEEKQVLAPLRNQGKQKLFCNWKQLNLLT